MVTLQVRTSAWSLLRCCLRLVKAGRADNCLGDPHRFDVLSTLPLEGHHPLVRYSIRWDREDNAGRSHQPPQTGSCLVRLMSQEETEM